jgi:hypothetical protein
MTYLHHHTGSHYLCDMSRQVTAVYAEESTVARFSIDAQATVHDLKQRSCSELAKKGERGYGFTNGFPHGGVGSIILSSGMIVI